MIQKSDYLVYTGPNPANPRAGAAGDKTLPLTPGVWQKEALETMGMYAPSEGNFTPVQQLTLFPMEPVAPTAEVKKLDLDDPNLPIPHKDSFRFFAKDTQRQIRSRQFYQQAATMPKGKHVDAVSATQGQLLVDGVTEMKEDQFPGRVQYTEGGLYTRDPGRPKNQKPSAELVAEHRHAPNYRKMEKKPIHGLGQPTKKGFADVLSHLGAKGDDPKPGKPNTGKPVVWTNTRAEAIVYINGDPYNLREMASRENLVLKEGASGAEVERMEEQLKARLLEKSRSSSPPGTIRVPLEEPGPDGKKFKDVAITESNVQTTREVVEEMKKPPNNFNIEYKRIPLVDEKSPSPAQLDEIRGWMNEVQARHPKDKDKMEYVFNCHQGRGRTTTGMVAAGIAMDGLDGRTVQLKLPFMTLGENAQERGDRVIDEAFHMQNLRETVQETQDKAAKSELDAKKYEEKAAAAKTEKERAENERLAQAARETKEKYEQHARDFTKRYALMQKYSEYIDQYGARSQTTSFDDWMKQATQTADLDKKWMALNTQLGVLIPKDLLPVGFQGRSDVALA